MFLPPQPFKTSFIFAFAVAVSQLSSNAAAQASTNLTNLLLPINDTIVLPIPSSLDEYWPVTTAASLSTLPPLNASSLNVSAAGPPKIACNGKLHGKNLNLASCVAAYNTIDAQTVIKTFGERGHGEWDINLPFRFQSCKSSFLPPAYSSDSSQSYPYLSLFSMLSELGRCTRVPFAKSLTEQPTDFAPSTSATKQTYSGTTPDRQT